MDTSTGTGPEADSATGEVGLASQLYLKVFRLEAVYNAQWQYVQRSNHTPGYPDRKKALHETNNRLQLLAESMPDYPVWIKAEAQRLAYGQLYQELVKLWMQQGET